MPVYLRRFYLQKLINLKEAEKEVRKANIQALLNDKKAALEVVDESVIIESNTVTSNSD